MILSPMYFEKDQLKQWLSAQQIAQFEGMYSDIVQTAYENALGLLYSEVGHILDLDTMLSETNPDKKDPTLKWVLLVMTAFNPSLNVSEPLRYNYEKVLAKVNELKSGMSSIYEAPTKSEPNALPQMVSVRNKYIG